MVSTMKYQHTLPHAMCGSVVAIVFDVLRALLRFCPLLWAAPLFGYAVLTHEAIIDSTWETNLRPLLLARFPGSTPDELREAHSYAYGGCILQDMGYYPFGSRFFSDLVHYVRSGDFVLNLLREASDRNEYAFALGALAHYAADNDGHTIAVNPGVPIEFPKMRRKFGPVVTYYQNPTAHMRLELAYDALEAARGSYAPKAYHDFIGFSVSRPLLERAFHDTYSIEIKDIFGDLDLALSTYRYAVSTFLPRVTQAAWKAKGAELRKSQPTLTRQKFVYQLSRASYRKEWKARYREPGIAVRLLAALIRILPKVGPLRVLDFHVPSAQTEALFEKSFVQTLEDYRRLLASVPSSMSLPNRDFDTGKPVRPTEYPLADDAYAELAVKLAKRDATDVDPAVRKDVMTFFADTNAPFATKKHRDDWKKTLNALAKLRAMPY
jgi:hypothetical protein